MSEIKVKPPTKKPKQNYIDNNRFLEEIKTHKARCALAAVEGRLPPRLNNYLGDCLLKIAEKMAYRPEFIHYSFNEEMKNDAIENMLTYFGNFDPERVGERSGIVTPFGYFSQITYYAFQRRILREEKLRYTKCKVLEHMFVSVDGDTLEEYNPSTNLRMAESVAAFIRRYEDRELKKKQKRDEKKKERANASKD
jgi:hypothetical protein